MKLPSTDFESVASAIPPHRQILIFEEFVLKHCISFSRRPLESVGLPLITPKPLQAFGDPEPPHRQILIVDENVLKQCILFSRRPLESVGLPLITPKSLQAFGDPEPPHRHIYRQGSENQNS